MSSARSRHRSILPGTGSLLTAAVMILLLMQNGEVCRSGYSRQGRKPVNTLNPAQESGLTLNLAVADPSAVYGTSLPFTITLTNTGALPVNLKDGSPENRAFSVLVTGPGNFQATGDAASIAVREGEHIDAPRTESRRTLQPGEAWTVDADLIPWVGDLAPGAYRVTARYVDSPPMAVVSKPRDIRIVDSAVIYVHPVRNLELLNEPRDSAWINRGSPGFDLFLLRSSPDFPPATYSNRRIAHLESAPRIFASAANIDGQRVRHMAWLDPEGELHILKVTVDGSGGTPISLSSPSPVAAIADPPFTDEQGTLFVVLLGRTGEALLLELPAGGKPRFIPLSFPLPPLHRLLWCRDHTLVLAWAGTESPELSYTTIPLDNRPHRPEIRKSLTLAATPADIRMAQRYHESDDGLDRLAVVLCRDGAKKQFVRQRIDFSTGKVEIEERFSAGSAISMSLIDSTLDRDYRPRFLFAAADGGVHFFNSDFVRDVPVRTSSGRSIRREDLPSLCISSEFSKKPGTYVMFVDAGRFAFVKIE